MRLADEAKLRQELSNVWGMLDAERDAVKRLRKALESIAQIVGGPAHDIARDALRTK